ncbi:hypothetical protein BIW11_07422 [Tropilaelaps mercedesae]|uniref:Uncharacterized protein n=1 Tax=Tropilaelaps mercedesae TaxID=418985 RepID=A0A1V9XU05_9ACAR|nr:hypothetical protein BIW11_07422 [Tropilaelaps mercedesae]
MQLTEPVPSRTEGTLLHLLRVTVMLAGPCKDEVKDATLRSRGQMNAKTSHREAGGCRSYRTLPDNS